MLVWSCVGMDMCQHGNVLKWLCQYDYVSVWPYAVQVMCQYCNVLVQSCAGIAMSQHGDALALVGMVMCCRETDNGIAH